MAHLEPLRQRKRVFQWIAAYALLAAVLNLGHFHRSHNADSLIPSLVSTVRWTPYYWRQDRYGMLLPWLAMPIQHPLANLLFITYCTIAGGIAAFFLLARSLFRDKEVWPLIGALSLTLLLTAASRHMLFEVFGTAAFYAPPLALALLALMCWEKDTWRARCLGVVLMGLASWYNMATPALVGGIILFRMAAAVRFRALFKGASAWREMAAFEGGAPWLVAMGFIFGVGLSHQSSFKEFEFKKVDTLADFRESVSQLAQHSWTRISDGLHLPYLILALGGCIIATAAGALLHRRFGRGLGQGFKGGIAGIAGAILYAGIAASQQWVKTESYDYRFWLPAWFVLIVACTGLATEPWLAFAGPRRRQILRVGTLVLAFAATLWRYGPPSTEHVRYDLAKLGSGEMSQDAIALNCTHITGDYWQVWPTVFRTNLSLYEMGVPRKVFGMANRFTQTRELWPEVPTWRIAVPAKQDLFIQTLARYNIHEVMLVAETPFTKVVTPH